MCAAAYDDLAAQLDAAACELPAHADEAKATVDRYAARGRAALRAELDGIEAAPMSSSARDAATSGAIGSFFAQLTAWQRMMGALADPAELPARVAEQNAAYWRTIQRRAYMASTYPESADAILEAATEHAAISGLRLGQLTPRAAYDAVEPPPPAGAARVAATAEHPGTRAPVPGTASRGTHARKGTGARAEKTSPTSPSGVRRSRTEP